MRHLYLDRLSRKKTTAGRGTIMTAATAAPAPVVTCHNCGKVGHYKSGCAMPGKLYRKGKTPQGKKAASSRGPGKKWCSVHETTSHSETECYAQEASRPQTGGAHTAAILSVNTDEKPTINFDDGFDFAFQVQLLKLQYQPSTEGYEQDCH